MPRTTDAYRAWEAEVLGQLQGLEADQVLELHVGDAPRTGPRSTTTITPAILGGRIRKIAGRAGLEVACRSNGSSCLVGLASAGRPSRPPPAPEPSRPARARRSSRPAPAPGSLEARQARARELAKEPGATYGSIAEALGITPSQAVRLVWPD